MKTRILLVSVLVALLATWSYELAASHYHPFNLPRVVKYRGDLYRVKVLAGIHYSTGDCSQGCLAYVDCHKREIAFVHTLGPEEFKYVLRHELMHVVTYCSKDDDWKSGLHDTIDYLSREMTQIFNENPRLREILR